jgi:hypothetical protein
MGTPSTWNATFTFFLDSATAVTTEHQISASEHNEALEGERLTPEQRVFVPPLRLFVASFFGRWYGTLVHQNLRSGQLYQKNPASSLLHRFSGTTRARNAVVALVRFHRSVALSSDQAENPPIVGSLPSCVEASVQVNHFALRTKMGGRSNHSCLLRILMMMDSDIGKAIQNNPRICGSEVAKGPILVRLANRRRLWTEYPVPRSRRGQGLIRQVNAAKFTWYRLT